MRTMFTLKNDIGWKAVKAITNSLLQYQLLWPNETDKRGTQNMENLRWTLKVPSLVLALE